MGLRRLALTCWPLFAHGTMRTQSLRLSEVSEAVLSNGSFWAQSQDPTKTPLPSVRLGAMRDV